MKSPVPIGRMVAEGTLIVTSILLAFAIQAWWEGRTEDRFEAELLERIAEDVARTREALNNIIERSDRDASVAAWFAEVPVADLESVPADSAVRVFLALARPNTFNALLEGPLSGALNSAEATSVRDPEVRAALGEWLQTAAELEERNQSSAELEIMVYEALGRHDAFRLRWVSGTDAVPDFVDMRPVRNDLDVLAASAAQSRFRADQRVHAMRLLGHLEDLAASLARLHEE